jgi:hypothetical protein
MITATTVDFLHDLIHVVVDKEISTVMGVGTSELQF